MSQTVASEEATSKQKIETMGKANQSTKKALSYPDETTGTKLAAEMRKKANNLSAEQKHRYFRKAMAIIYGGNGAKETACAGR